MHKFLLAAVAALSLAPSLSHADTNGFCYATVLHDVRSNENPAVVLHRGQRHLSVSQFRRDIATGETRLCLEHGACFPTHVADRGRLARTLRLDNCHVRLGRVAYRDDTERFYDLAVNR